MDYKEIPGFPRYGINTDGEIKNFESGKTFKGCPDNHGYYQTTLIDSKGSRKKARIHVLMAITYLEHIPCGYKIVVDHRDNKRRFDNSLGNLQLITQGENVTKDKKSVSSKYLGISWNSRSKKWWARIRINGKNKHLGYFLTEEEAYQAYLKALNRIH